VRYDRGGIVDERAVTPTCGGSRERLPPRRRCCSGTGMAQQHLRNTLAYLDMPTLGQPEVLMQVKEDFFDQAGADFLDTSWLYE
jgi:hypothetical protein